MTLSKQDFIFFQNVHIGLSSLAFGVTLSMFLYAYASHLVQNTASWLLYISTFFLMLRFWYQYVAFYGKQLPSYTFGHFLLDFLIAFFGNLAILSVNNIAAWTVSVCLALLVAIGRCKLAIPDANKLKNQIKEIAKRCLALIIALAIIWLFVAKPFGALHASVIIFILTIGHVIYAWKRYLI